VIVLLDLCEVGLELRQALGRTFDAALLEEVRAVGDEPGARVVRDAVQLAVEHGRLLQAREPVARVVERALVGADVRERACSHVLRHLGVAHLDDVGHGVRGDRRVELLQVIAPALVLHVHVPAVVVGLELVVGGRYDGRPAVLGIHLEPDGERVRLC
jgi:hypothetical protein